VRIGDVAVEGADEQVDRLVGGAQHDAAVGRLDLLEQLEGDLGPAVPASRPVAVPYR
jgi:hypothetical protein